MRRNATRADRREGAAAPILPLHLPVASALLAVTALGAMTGPDGIYQVFLAKLGIPPGGV